MVTKPTNAYERTRVSYIINIASLLRVSANLVANLREVHYKGHITDFFEPVHKSQVLGSKTFVINPLKCTTLRLAPRMAETCTVHAMFIIQDTFIRLYAFVGFITISNQLDAWSWII